jgi:hypothetical protein
MDGSASAALDALWVRHEWRTQRLARPAQGCAGGRTPPWTAQPLNSRRALADCLEWQSAHRIRPAQGCAGGSSAPWTAQPQLHWTRSGSALNGGPSGWLGPRGDARAGTPRPGRLSRSCTEAKACRERVSRNHTQTSGGKASLQIVGAPYARIGSGFGRSQRVPRVRRRTYAHISFDFDSGIASVQIDSARFQTLVSLIETADSQRVSRFPR